MANAGNSIEPSGQGVYIDTCRSVVFQEDNDSFALTLRQMAALRIDGKFCDVKLKVGTKVFLAHRNILAVRIPYFQAMFSSNLMESTQEKIEMKNLVPNVFKDLLEFAYTGKITVADTNVESLISSANYLGMNILVASCTNFLKSRFEPSSVLKIRSLADSLELRDLYTAANDYIMRNFFKLISCDDFLLLMDKVTLEDLLKKDELQVFSEEQVYEVLFKWYAYDMIERKDAFVSLFPCIRLPLMNPQFLVICKEEVEIIKSTECGYFIEQAVFHAFIPERPLPLNLYATPRWCYGENRSKAAVISVLFNCSKMKVKTANNPWIYSKSSVMFSTCQVPWKLYYGRVLEGTEDYLALFLNKPEEYVSYTPWKVEYELLLISRTHEISNYGRKGEGNVSYPECRFGFNTFIKWSTVMNPENGYLKNDSVILQARFRIMS